MPAEDSLERRADPFDRGAAAFVAGVGADRDSGDVDTSRTPGSSRSSFASVLTGVRWAVARQPGAADLDLVGVAWNRAERVARVDVAGAPGDLGRW